MFFSDLIDAFNHFLDQGGVVLTLIFMVTLLLFALFSYRFIIVNIEIPKALSRKILNQEINRHQRLFFQHYFQRHMLFSHDLIKFIIALLPMLGLLGTVTGMIQLFEVMAQFGNSNPRLMAQGVAQAIIPTMSGMAIAVLALISYYFLQQSVKKQQANLAKHLCQKGHHASF